MKHGDDHDDPFPWYKQFWPWFLLGLLFTSIFGSSTLAVMAIRTADGLVQEDYYEHGRAINMVLAKQQRAEELDLVANLRIDPMTSDIIVQLDGAERPERLYLKLLFPTVGDRDQEIVLEHVREGRYLVRRRTTCATAGICSCTPARSSPNGAWSVKAASPATRSSR